MTSIKVKIIVESEEGGAEEFEKTINGFLSTIPKENVIGIKFPHFQQAVVIYKEKEPISELDLDLTVKKPYKYNM